MLISAALSMPSISTGFQPDEIIKVTGRKAVTISDSSIKNADKGFPETLTNCLFEKATNVQYVGIHTTTERSGDTDHNLKYHLFLYEMDGEHQQTALLEFGSVCGTAYDSWLGLEMSEMMPMEVAQSLSLLRYQYIAETIGGVQELKRMLLESLTPALDGTLSRFAPENIWALGQLGIVPPEDKYELIEIEPYTPGQFSQ